MKKILLFGFIFIMMISLVIAQPSFQSLDNKLTLETILIEEHPLNNPFYLHTHVYDSETGLLINSSNLNCNYQLYSENIGWGHLDTGILTPYGAGLYTLINESNFTDTGNYAILFWCETDEIDSIGGFTQYNFIVTASETGLFKLGSTALYFIIGLGILLIILSFSIKEAIFGLLGSMIFLLTSIYLIPIFLIVGVISLISSILLLLYFGFNL